MQLQQTLGQLGLTLKDPFLVLQQYGYDPLHLKQHGKLAIIDFDKKLQSLSLADLRTLLLILECKDTEGIALLPHARAYGNEVMIPRLAANIIIKIALRIEQQMFSVQEVAVLGNELVAPRVFWSIEEGTRQKLFLALFKVMIDPHRHVDKSECKIIEALVRKIAVTSNRDLSALLLYIEQLVHLNRIDLQTVKLIKEIPKINAQLVEG